MEQTFVGYQNSIEINKKVGLDKSIKISSLGTMQIHKRWYLFRSCSAAPHEHVK